MDLETAADFAAVPDWAERTRALRVCKSTPHAVIHILTGCLLAFGAANPAARAQSPEPLSRIASESEPGHRGHADPPSTSSGREDLRELTARLERIATWAMAWYRRTPAGDRVTWGGMAACVGLGLYVVLERLVRLRRRKIMPAAFTARFLDRLHEGKLDCGQALDHCELNPSPAARVALAAVRRWGRPAADLERAVALAHRVETEVLRRNVGTLRRIAVLSPLLGLLGTLFALGRALDGATAISAPGSSGPSGSAFASPSWGPALAAALTPLSAGIVIATLSLVAYDALLTRIEKLSGGLDRLGAETIDAIALAAPISTPAFAFSPGEQRSGALRPEPIESDSAQPGRSPHQSYFRLDDGSGMIRRPAQHRTGY
jgi:biopolymer transport protein ExbB